MSNYWKKKLDELEKSNAKSSSSSSKKSSSSSSGNYWDKKMSELEESEKKIDRDIAPVKTTTTKKEKEEDDRSWFQKGAFDDGYQFGDVTKTILGTLTDTSENLATGVLGMGEKAVDAGAYVAGGLGKLFKADDFVERTEQFISKDLYDEAKIAKKIVQSDLIERAIGVDSEDSIFGEKTDSLMQSAGQLGGTIALQAVGVPWFVTTGLTSFGGEVESAFNEGATYGEAGLSAAITAGAEMLTEKISGGISFGGKTLDDALTKQIARGISDKTVRTLTKLGVDMVGEGAEEVLSGTMSAIGQKITYADDKELTELFSKEEAWESFVGGAVLGGGMSGANVVKSAKRGVDYASGLTENEQKVVDKVFEDRVKEAEKNGTISEKEKSKIYDEVLNEMERGGISTDTIEEVLGGDTYQNYQNTVKNEDSLRETFNELNKMKQGEMTGEQIDLRNELKEKLKELDSKGERNQLKSRLGDEVMSLVQGDRLIESYNERSRRGQAFEADLTKYNDNQKAVVQKAIDSGILNNTRRTHEFVDMVSKISADKGVLFDFANNAKLKESGFAMDGKTVNGFVTKDGVTLNIDSAKSLNSVVGHEITHVLEGTELYTALQSAVVEYAKTKGDYQGRYDSLSELYKDIEGADIDAELTSDLVGDYLFTDSDFINNLSVNNRNVFQKIYDEIKYLCKVATAGSKEARELEKVKRAFEKAYKEGGKAQTDTKYSLGYHAGDLGKAESYIEQGGYRNTGHFGTGTYFVGDEAKISDSSYGKRPHHAVEFDNYNLYKIRNDKDGYDLHDQLRVIDGGYTSQEFLDAAKAKEMRASSLRSSAWERAEDYDNQVWNDEFEMLVSSDYIGANIRAFTEVANENGVEIQSYDEWFAEQSLDESDYDYYKSEYYDYLKETLESVDSEKNKGYDKFRDAYFHLWLRFGQDNVNRALQDVIEYDAKMDASDHDAKRKADSLATVFMKSLGYEGIDVRGSGLDNTTYGSVIYDLKGDDLAKKKAIGTAKFSISDSDYLDAVNRGDTDSAQMMVDEAAKAAGYTVKAYHGTARSDRVGNVFLPERATSGPMAFFTDSREIAENYARDKADTSLAYDEEYTDYYSQFRVNRNGKSIKVQDLWRSLPFAEKQRLKEAGKHITWDEDMENIVWDDDATRGLGNWDAYTLNEHKGNAIEALIDCWLESGELYNNEGDFIQVLELAGINGVEYRDPDARYEKVYDAYLKIQNPFNTATVDESFVSGFEKWYSQQPEGKYERDTASADMWDKNSQTAEKFIARVRSDIEGGTSYAWTSIPDSVTDYLKSLGHDGIQDTGGKNGGETHTVWIPFSSEQVKSADAITRDDNGNVIPLAERFNPGEVDIRYSLSNEGEQTPPVGKYNVFGKDIALETVAENATVEESAPVPETEPVQEVAPVVSAENETTTIEHSVSDLVDIAKQARRENMRGAYTHNGKQYLSDGSFIAEFNAVDESLEQSNDFPIKQAIKELDEAFARKVEGNYDLHTSDTKGFVKVGNSLFGTKRVNAIIRALENPVFSIANVHGGHEALVVTGDNGRAVLMPVRASGNAYLVYEAQPIADAATFPDDLAPTEYDTEQFDSLTDADAPPEIEAPYTEDEEVTVDDPFEERDWHDVGNKKVKAYMYENPEVKPFFQAEAKVMLGELRDTTKGERWYNDKLYYETGGEEGFGGTKRHTSDDIAYLLDEGGFTYAEIEKGLNAIIEDNGAENIAAAKRIEFILNDRLLNGYQDFWIDYVNPPDQNYINLLNEKQITEYSKESFDAFMAEADKYAPPISEEIAEEPMVETNIGKMPLPEYRDMIAQQRGFDDYADMRGQGTMLGNSYDTDDIAPVKETSKPKPEAYEAIKPKKEKHHKLIRVDEGEHTAKVMVEEPENTKKKRSLWSRAKELVLDKGMVFENLSLKTGNDEVQARFHSIRNAETKAQRRMDKALKPIVDKVNKSGKTQDFYNYLYHQLNVDRMTLADRYDDVPNKPVFGNAVTAKMSQEAARKLENANPEFKIWAEDVYNYNRQNRELLVEGGVISREVADLWEEMYPHFVPIRRAGDTGLNINVPLDTGRTGINAPIKRATGGSRDILPLFDTMGQRTMQTYKAIAKNRFGVELKNTLGTTIADESVDVDDVIDSVDAHEELLQEGKNGQNPTFTVFEDGKKVTFEITEEMYSAMKPTSEVLAYTNKPLNVANNIRRGLLTEYNPTFLLTNAIKDTQDVLVNSKHPKRTYASYPKAISELIGKNGRWYQEYMENGGEQLTYFDKETNTFTKEPSAFRKVIGFPLDKISDANNFIERIPRMAEYIASREMGRSIDVSMLDAARVTTNFQAGGDLTKLLNRNGFTFLNASVQGAVQQVRNVREAKANGLKGAMGLAAKIALAGLPSMLLNHLLWDDDEDYEELSDYVKQNYYIVGKYGDGNFVRIPKGRALAVIQNAFEQMENMITGDDEADWGAFGKLVISNLAPNNPLDNNIFAPIAQTLGNETWYGEDLVPTRLQDLPTAEQYDETTDSISRWLGERLPISPYKINYLLDQYSGGVGDVVLPMLTPEAERGDDSLAGNTLAPLKDKFTTDSVMKNQNVSDFYDIKDELTMNANGSDATDDDILMSKYMNSVGSDLNELYKQKREVQNSTLSDANKYAQVRAIQNQIVELTKQALDNYENIERDGDYANIGETYFQWYKPEEGEPYWRKLTETQKTKYLVTKDAGNANYATDGTVHYRRDEDGEWTKISDKQLKRQNEVTRELGITPEEYWSKTDISFMPMSDGEYEYAYDNPENYSVAKAVGGYDAYRTYSKDLYNIKADKDKNGKSISGSRKEKVLDYINNLDADYYTKIILWKSEYTSDDSYNREIIEYLDSREDITYEEEVTILKKLGFEVSSDGTISW